MSRKNQMREFAGTHDGQTFSATRLAKEMKWKTNAKSVIGIARKCGAQVAKVERKIPTRTASEGFRDRTSIGYDITF